MFTNKDINKLEKVFIIKAEFTDFKDQMMAGFDTVMHELRSLKEEITVMFYRQSENYDTRR